MPRSDIGFQIPFGGPFISTGTIEQVYQASFHASGTAAQVDNVPETSTNKVKKNLFMSLVIYFGLALFFNKKCLTKEAHYQTITKKYR